MAGSYTFSIRYKYQPKGSTGIYEGGTTVQAPTASDAKQQIRNTINARGNKFIGIVSCDKR